MNDIITNTNTGINVQKYSQEANNLSMINNHMYHQVGLYSRNVRSLENHNNRYWDAQANFNQIMNNEERKYNYFKNKEQSILCDMNRLNQHIRFWRFKDKFYFRPSQFSELIVADEKAIAKEIGSRYGNINIYFVSDLNEALSYKKAEIRIDTTYIAINSIPVIDEDIFDPTRMDEVFVNFKGLFSRNHLSYTSYLANRFYHSELIDEPYESYAKHVIQKITTVKDLKILVSRLGNFFKHLNSSKAIVLVGNKDVSEGVLLNRVLKPIFGSQFCVTITDEMLQSEGIGEIIKHKLIYHIDHIPDDEKDREKLQEILISILVDKFIMIEDKFVPIHGQVLITLNEAHPFLKDFLSSSDVFFVDSMENIMTNLQEEDKISFHKKLYSSLTTFSKELSVLGNTPSELSQNTNQNEDFVKLLDSIDENIVKLIEDNILDPFSSNFENLIPLTERYKHTYVTGMTGSGKSQLLKILIMADILRADGNVILLEPHGDLAQEVTKLVKDKTRLVYINPFLSESKTPTINLFHLSNKSEANIARLTQVILNVLKGVNSDETFTGAMEDVLEMCIRVLLRKGGGSFQELYRFLNDNRNEDLVQFGINSPNQLESEFFEDDFESSKPTKGAIRRRLKKLLNDPTFSGLMNGKNTIDLEQAMNTKGQIIIFNIPKGKMPNTYKYYIRFIVEYIQILALKRADVAEEDRTHTHLYIDEAHNFITSTATISEILTESRKYKLFVTFAHQAITQIRDTNLRDIMTTMTNVKIIGKNSNKTLEAMNKTLNTKLEDVEKLNTGEFYLSAGNNDIIKVNVTDKLVDAKEDITQVLEEEQKQYQLEHYYRSVENIDDKVAPSEYLNQIFDEFINAIKSIDIPYFEKLQAAPKLYEELIYNFNDEADDASGYISKQDLYQYFNLIYPENSFINNKNLLKLFKIKDDFFKQDVNTNKTYNSKKRLFIS
ncbi:type IV secretory system conjugative DNA transfer family protein [Sulfurimonas sp. CS5]|uniref:type IV secretory system conjugative DNA transfer family protein n=1 Tax=Sulfurimonas sp. CS5 TaxID=3391145 RepID=UPI0039EC2346